MADVGKCFQMLMQGLLRTCRGVTRTAASDNNYRLTEPETRSSPKRETLVVCHAGFQQCSNLSPFFLEHAIYVWIGGHDIGWWSFRRG